MPPHKEYISRQARFSFFKLYSLKFFFRSTGSLYMFQTKLPHVGQTIFSHMTALAQKHGALNLSQGFPDFAIAPRLIALAGFYMQKGYNQYAPMPGVAALREAISRFYTQAYDPQQEVCITHGATQAIATAISCSVSAGDEVLLFAPAYDCYAPMVQLNGGKPVFVNLSFPGYRIDWELVRSKLSPKTRMLIINTPHNPSGTLLTEEDFLQLQEITRGTNLLVLSDEVYQHIVFDGMTHRSAADFAELRKRSFVIGSFGKSLNITGWKIGYCAAPERLMREFKKAHQFMVFSVNHALQYALADYLKEADLAQLSMSYQRKRDIFLSALANSRFSPLPTKGSYFQLLDYSAITQEEDTLFAERLTQTKGVASIPLSVFYEVPQHNKVLRFCFAKNEETLKVAGDRLSVL